MSIITYPVTLTEYTIYTGSYKESESNVVTTVVFQLSNTAYRAIVRFYDIPYNQIPSNGVYVSDYNVNLPLSSLGGFLSLLQDPSVSMVFNFDSSNYEASFTGNPV